MQNTGKLLKNRTLVTIGVAESISGIGDWITMMAIFAILVFRGTGGVAESSGIFMAGLLPTLPASLAAGWLCDRYDRKFLMIVSLLVSGAVVSGLIFTENMVLIYALLALQAVSVSIMTPARQSVLPDIVPAEELTRANALLQQLAGIIKIGAPMIAGALLAVLNPHQAIILDVISFAIAALLLTFLPAMPPHKRSETGMANGVLPSRETIFMVLNRIPGLRLVFLSVFLAILIIVGFDVSVSVFIRDFLLAEESFMGLCIGLVGVGTLIATTLLLTRKTKNDHWRDVVIALSLLAVIPLSLTLCIYLAKPEIGRFLVLGGCLVGGIGNGLFHVQVTTLLQTLTPPEMLGRMGGAFQSSAVAGQLVGIVITPILLAKFLSMGQYYGISFICLVILMFYILFILWQNKQNSRLSPVPANDEI
jgi:MFS family permease